MDITAEIAAFDLPPALAGRLEQWVNQARLQAEQATMQAMRATEEATRLAAELKARDLQYAAVVHELARLKRLRFGASSEALSANLRDLFEETLAADIAACEARLDALRQREADAASLPPTLPASRRPRGGRPPLPAHLERIEHRHEPETCTCGQCGADLVKIGEDISEQLDIIPARFIVHRHIRPQYACRTCETVEAAVVPPAIIDGGLPTARLLAWVGIAKYVDHLPLYRLEGIAAREQVPLARSTLSDWIGQIGVALEPLADRLRVRLLEGEVLHADETPVQQLEPGTGKTRKAYLWAYCNNALTESARIVVFDYQPGRSGQYARDFLRDWRGHLMVDDYGGYKSLWVGGVVELGCFAHARRKFFDLHVANQSAEAAEALRRIGELYALEQPLSEATIEVRAQMRAQHAVPRLEALHLWLQATRARAADGSSLARALDYSLKRWPALSRYATRGDLPIDNNPIENAIRPIALGKKNWLFTGSETAGRRAAAIQSLLATAKANSIEPMAWLTDTLEKLPTWPNSRIDELLPIKKLEPAQALG
jgi:transposase